MTGLLLFFILFIFENDEGVNSEIYPNSLQIGIIKSRQPLTDEELWYIIHEI